MYIFFKTEFYQSQLQKIYANKMFITVLAILKFDHFIYTQIADTLNFRCIHNELLCKIRKENGCI